MARAALSRRERQILDIVYEKGEATAAEVLAAMPDPPSDAAVRSSLRILERKGHLRHRADGPRYVYAPTVARAVASRSALQHLMRTFFDGRPESVMAALVELESDRLEPGAVARLERIIAELGDADADGEQEAGA